RVSPRGRHGARPPVPQNLRRGGSSPAALPLAGERAGTPERHSPGDPPRYGGDRAGAPVGPPRRAVPGDRTLGRAGAGRVLSEGHRRGGRGGRRGAGDPPGPPYDGGEQERGDAAPPNRLQDPVSEAEAIRH